MENKILEFEKQLIEKKEILKSLKLELHNFVMSLKYLSKINGFTDTKEMLIRLKDYNKDKIKNIKFEIKCIDYDIRYYQLDELIKKGLNEKKEN